MKIEEGWQNDKTFLSISFREMWKKKRNKRKKPPYLPWMWIVNMDIYIHTHIMYNRILRLMHLCIRSSLGGFINGKKRKIFVCFFTCATFHIPHFSSSIFVSQCAECRWLVGWLVRSFCGCMTWDIETVRSDVRKALTNQHNSTGLIVKSKNQSFNHFKFFVIIFFFFVAVVSGERSGEKPI